MRHIEANISDFDAAEIAGAWHSVMTWNDPGVWMYSVTSTGRIHSEEHRAGLLRYVDTCLLQAAEFDRRGDAPVLECHGSNVEELAEFRMWVVAFEIEAGDDEDEAPDTGNPDTITETP